MGMKKEKSKVQPGKLQAPSVSTCRLKRASWSKLRPKPAAEAGLRLGSVLLVRVVALVAWVAPPTLRVLAVLADPVVAFVAVLTSAIGPE